MVPICIIIKYVRCIYIYINTYTYVKAAPLFQVPFHLVACIEANLLNSGEKLMQAGVVFESRKIPVVPQAGFLTGSGV